MDIPNEALHEDVEVEVKVQAEDREPPVDHQSLHKATLIELQ